MLKIILGLTLIFIGHHNPNQFAPFLIVEGIILINLGVINKRKSLQHI